MLILVLFAFIAGIVTVLSPCILPVLPIILSAATVKGRLRPLGIIVGLIISFTFFTLALTAIVRSTGLSANALRYAAIVLIFLFGVIMIFPKLSDLFAKWTAPVAGLGQGVQSLESGSGFKGGFLLGIALGLLWTPCAGPILAAITTLVATQSVNFTTVLITLAYSIGAAIPLFLITYGGSQAIQSSRYLSQHAEGIRKMFGCLMVLTAVAIALHWDMVIQQKITPYLPPVLIEDNSYVKQELVKLGGGDKSMNKAIESLVPDQFSNFGPAPEIVGIVNWINSPPLSLMMLKGKVVLIDFWTYSCINCLRTLPYLEKWYKDYGKKGLVIIGVHSPEFEFEKDPMNVADAAKRLGVKYPIAQDNDFATWRAYGNHYWPAHYLIDQNGDLRMAHFGEGDYVATENAIRTLLGMAPLKMEEPKQAVRPISHETYLGTGRGKSYTKQIQIIPGQTVDYTYSKPLMDEEVGLKGLWKIEDERITSEGDKSELNLNYLAKQVYLVISGSSSQSIEVYLDGKFIKSIKLDGDRKYDIVNASYGHHQLSLKIPKGISAYAFTFGNE